MLRCAITDGRSLGGGAGRWADEGIDFVQLRAKTLEAGELADVGRSILHNIAATGSTRTKLLINGRADVALAIGAAGVHLSAREDELTPEQVRRIFASAGCERPIVSVSCHTLDEIRRAKENSADYILFGPVFEKRIGGELVSEGVGLDRLREACHLAQDLPVLALGGVTLASAPLCIAAGAAGIAGIRAFS
jgi:thiamine-phosphate pyrophosphorylase